MTLEETMHAIEQDQFAAEMSLAAGTKAFRRAIREHELFKRLSELALAKALVVFGRIEAISRLEVDERYENRFDAALCAYVMALSDVAETGIVHDAAQTVLKTPKCWWAAGITRELLLETVAVGAIGVGVDWREAIYVRLNEWLTAVDSSLRKTTTRELLKAVSAGQPAGQSSKVIEFPSQEQRLNHHHVVSKSLIKRKQQRVQNIAKARRRA